LQRQCVCDTNAKDGKCDKCREKGPGVQRLAGLVDPIVAPPIVHDVLQSPGRPLDAVTRAFMEPRFGHDFSKVRVHVGAQAAESARAVSSLAYTVGHHVVFAEGRYAPTTPAGRRLLAHELTHVVQQEGQPNLSRAELEVNRPGDPFEQEAEQVADAVMRAGALAHQPIAVADGPLLPFDETEEPFSQGLRMGPPTRPGVGQGNRERRPAVGASSLLRLQRTATFAAGSVHATRNNAEQVAAGRAAGTTIAVLNGTLLMDLATAKAAIQPPTLGGESLTGGGVRCWVGSVATNMGSFDETVLNQGPWSAVVDKATLGARLGLSACASAGGGKATFTVKGVPSDADVAAKNRTHEDHHAADITSAFNGSVVPWDKNLTKAQAAQTSFQGPDVDTCEATLFGTMGGKPEDVAANYLDAYSKTIAAFHATPAGKPIDISNQSSDPSCDVVTAEARAP
jgi:hypothetical protein